jgi:hypothetical protein
VSGDANVVSEVEYTEHDGSVVQSPATVAGEVE